MNTITNLRTCVDTYGIRSREANFGANRANSERTVAMIELGLNSSNPTRRNSEFGLVNDSASMPNAQLATESIVNRAQI